MLKIDWKYTSYGLLIVYHMEMQGSILCLKNLEMLYYHLQ